MGLGKQGLNLADTFMHRRRNDVRRCFTGQLNDVLTEVSFHRLNTGGAQRLIQPRLFREHRLRLGDLAHSMPPGDINHQIADFITLTRPQHLRAARPGPFFKDVEPDIEIIQNTVADFFIGLAQGFKFQPIISQPGNGLATLARKQRLSFLQGCLQTLVPDAEPSPRLKKHGL